MLLRVLSTTHTHISTTRTFSAATYLVQTCLSATLTATQTCFRTCTNSPSLAVRRMSSTTLMQNAIYLTIHALYHLKPTAPVKTQAAVSQLRRIAAKTRIARMSVPAALSLVRTNHRSNITHTMITSIITHQMDVLRVACQTSAPTLHIIILDHIMTLSQWITHHGMGICIHLMWRQYPALRDFQ